MGYTGEKQSKSGSRKKSGGGDFKVVYISSPMKVKTSASKFRSLVQKLTGQDSDAESFMELIAAADHRSSLHSPAAPFLDHQLLGDDGGGDLKSAEDLVNLQKFDHGSFAELFHGFLHESELPGFSSLL